ncbi:Crp/Fnr family transcriptional regulator [Agrilutibacter solisilvae]|uniref:CRP-like protein Clp n=1 Tax=Agrilutibacter solisilvae TaxID=2763317 RepID=A0A974Y4C7_9GAMM|nr:helix-turn-helix domain-containing protein [Lysobacter solisilvae]QSX77671.1 helix-turn-helix domain-containing protein [Lysobacter solisilvae]
MIEVNPGRGGGRLLQTVTGLASSGFTRSLSCAATSGEVAAMLDISVSSFEAIASSSVESTCGPGMQREYPLGLEQLLQALPLKRRRLKAREYLFRAGQKRESLFFVHAGFFKTCLSSADGREKITGFRMRGDLLGIDSLDMDSYACDVISLDVGEVWELPVDRLRDRFPHFHERLTGLLAGEIRRDWGWMLALGTLSAEQRVIAFLLDFAARLEHLGFSARSLMLHMTRAEIGNFLSLQLETVTRALSRLQAAGLIAVDRREIRIHDAAGLQAMMAGPH